MKETILDILMYLFTEVSGNEPVIDPGQPDLVEALEEAGFDTKDINKALGWLESFALGSEQSTHNTNKTDISTRIFSIDENQKIDLPSRNFITRLSNLGLIDNQSRELIIERIMTLDVKEVNLRQVKWISFMVLANTQKDVDQNWLQELILKLNLESDSKKPIYH